MATRAERKEMRECKDATLTVGLEVLFEPVELVLGPVDLVRRRHLAVFAVEGDQVPGRDPAAGKLFAGGKVQRIVSRLWPLRRAVLRDHLCAMLFEVSKIRRSVLGFVLMIARDRQDKLDVLAPALVKAILKLIRFAADVGEIAQRQHPDWNSAHLRIGNFLTEQIGRLLLSIAICRSSFRVVLAFGNVSCRQQNTDEFLAWFRQSGQSAWLDNQRGEGRGE